MSTGPEFDRRSEVERVEIGSARDGDAYVVTLRFHGHAVIYLPPSLARQVGQQLIDYADTMAPAAPFVFECVNPTHDHSRDPAPETSVEGREQRISCGRSRP